MVYCLISLALLPAGDIPQGFTDVETVLSDNCPSKTALKQLICYIKWQWITKTSMGPRKADCIRQRILYKQRHGKLIFCPLMTLIIITHPNLFSFLGNLQRLTADNHVRKKVN